MPLDLGGMLTRKIGPAPGWVWALGVGGIAYFLGPKLLKGGSAATSSTTAAGDTGMNPQSYGQGFTAGRGYMRPAASGATARSQFSLDNIPGVGAAIHA